MDINRTCVPADFILKNSPVLKIPEIQNIIPHNPSRLTDAHQASRPDQFHILISRKIISEIIVIFQKPLALLDIGFRKGSFISTVHSECVADVPSARNGSYPPHSGQAWVLQREDFILKGFFQHPFLSCVSVRGRPVNSGPQAAQGARHHIALLVSFFKRCACPRRQITVPGCIHKDFRLNGKNTAFRRKHHRGNSAFFLNNINQTGMKGEADASFNQHFII